MHTLSPSPVDRMIRNASLLILVLSTPVLYAGKADVLDATVNCDRSRSCSFQVTVQHADSGWDHYANQWQLLSEDGAILGTRVLYHPHETEQPFTRSLSGVKIPAHVQSVTIRAGDLVHGFGGREIQMQLPPIVD
jgi:hypothetical protein